MLPVKIINTLIDSLYHCWFLIEVKEVSKQQIMCDYDDSVLTWGRLESHLGSSYDSNRLLLIMSWTARKRTTTFPPLPSLVFEETVRHFVKRFYTFLMKMAPKGTAHLPACTLSNIFSRSSAFHRPTSRSARFAFKVAIISHLRWHLQSDEGEVKSLRWLIIISKVPCHAADLNKRVWSSICMHLYAWAKRLIS